MTGLISFNHKSQEAMAIAGMSTNPFGPEDAQRHTFSHAPPVTKWYQLLHEDGSFKAKRSPHKSPSFTSDGTEKLVPKSQGIFTSDQRLQELT